MVVKSSNDDLMMFHGVRFISFLEVVFGHVYMVYILLGTNL